MGMQKSMAGVHEKMRYCCGTNAFICGAAGEAAGLKIRLLFSNLCFSEDMTKKGENSKKKELEPNSHDESHIKLIQSQRGYRRPLEKLIYNKAVNTKPLLFFLLKTWTLSAQNLSKKTQGFHRCTSNTGQV